MNLPHRNGSAAQAPSEAWLRSSVQQFFSTFNWDNTATAVQDTKRSAIESGNTDPLNLSVCQFFAAIHWDGSPIATTPPAAPPPVAAADDLTLEDFSDLFT